MQRKYSRPAQLRVTWLEQYEATLIALCPQLAGKVCWNTALYLYNRGELAIEAAKRVAANKQVRA